MYRLINGDNRQILKQFPDNHFDSIVTDPPYGIDFLGKSWDANTGALETYQECLRVLKPGGHILAFSAARTYHHLAITLEQAGFEIRDQIMWIYSSGFPKSQDVGKNNNMSEWQGWGTNLKPAHEPICMARKPIKTSIAKNVEKWGTGALNIDATRIPIDDELKEWYNKYPEQKSKAGVHTNYNPELREKVRIDKQPPIDTSQVEGRFPSNVLGEIPDYQKYFYCPKVSRRERHIGFEDPGPLFPGADGGGREMLAQRDAMVIKNKSLTTDSLPVEQNNHPTVKPVALMEYLIKLITPPNGLVLDPFNGSGTTGMAAVELGFDYTGIELDAHYVDISRRRIEAWYKTKHPLMASGIFKYVESGTETNN
jgi:DNA modification methylase